MSEKAIAEARYRPGHGKQPVFLFSSEEVDKVIDDLLTGPEDQNLAELYSLKRDLLPSGFPDHSFMIGVDRGRSVGLVSFSDSGGSFVTVGEPGGNPEFGYLMAGHHTEFEIDSEIPLALVREASRQFLATGGRRPTCVEWQTQI
ncbi:hypothetical protein GCM10010329_85910 [Streptomyces spiroverticillatus]|uniref:Immunity protein Imm1 n=1 Tax=Streptomyces finlayi TaxID=67296 RepID=A0A919CGI2_9ACTN|nr:Imm1 family immunity protein [Streptomyces finlayi]GHA50731.1 hypothetical protein GCM10010329_85910 [Streptomyces spiroverticillatus]GHD19937.1 hypothetical protein GCM10010334_83980 [Streptomyces finlayi]